MPMELPLRNDEFPLKNADCFAIGGGLIAKVHSLPAVKAWDEAEAARPAL